MPSQYAHYRFGKLLLPTLPPDVRQCIGRFRRMYDMGLQGPDIFFYHNIFMQTAAGDLGGQFHSQSGRDFFPRACKQADSEAARAYLYGLLGHYCLDSASHPFVNRLDGAGEAAHVPLEKEFDRFLMAMDGVGEPHFYDFGPLIRLTRGECVTVAGFYPPATPGNVNQSVKSMAFCLKFLARKNRAKVVSLLNRVKPSTLEHLIPEEPVEAFQRHNSELLARFNLCLKDYHTLLAQLTAHMKNGEELGEAFDASFG